MAKHLGKLHLVPQMKQFERLSNRSRASAWTLLARKCHFRPQAMAQNADISVGHLRRLCQEVFGESLGDWLRRERMVAARQVLRESRSVKATMELLGYRHRRQFVSDFRSAYETLPTEWLRSISTKGGA